MTESNTLLTANAIPIERGFRLRFSFMSTKDDPQTVAARFLILDNSGNLSDSAEQFIVPGLTVPSEFFTNLTDGQLISATVSPVEETCVFGEVFCKIDLIRGNVIDGSSIIPLTAGYIDTTAGLNYPLSPFEDSYSENGATRARPGSNPAAGAEITTNGFDAIDSEIHGGTFRLVTSAGAANRTVTLNFLNGAVPICEVTSRTVQTASQTRLYRLWCGPNIPTDVGTTIYLPVPDRGPWNELVFSTTTANIQAGDQFSLITFWLRERIRKIQ